MSVFFSVNRNSKSADFTDCQKNEMLIYMKHLNIVFIHSNIIEHPAFVSGTAQGIEVI